jgi:hypothetical protein
MKKLADNLNVEIVLETVRSSDEAVEWLGLNKYFYGLPRKLQEPS